MPGQHPGRAEPFDLRERLERLLRVERERGGLRAGCSGQDVPGGEGIADEDGIHGGHVDRDAAGRVTGDVDDLRPAGQIEGGAIGDGLELGHPRRVQAALPSGVPEKAKERTDLHRSSARARFANLAARARCIGLVNEDGDAVVTAKTLGEADVIGVAVGQDQPANVAHGSAHCLQLGLEVAPLAGNAGIDQCHSAVFLDEVGRDDVVADAVEGRRELHRLLIVSRIAPRSDVLSVVSWATVQIMIPAALCMARSVFARIVAMPL